MESGTNSSFGPRPGTFSDCRPTAEPRLRPKVFTARYHGRVYWVISFRADRNSVRSKYRIHPLGPEIVYSLGAISPTNWRIFPYRNPRRTVIPRDLPKHDRISLAGKKSAVGTTVGRSINFWTGPSG